MGFLRGSCEAQRQAQATTAELKVGKFKTRRSHLFTICGNFPEILHPHLGRVWTANMKVLFAFVGSKQSVAFAPAAGKMDERAVCQPCVRIHYTAGWRGA